MLNLHKTPASISKHACITYTMDYIFRLISFTNFNSEVFVKKVETDNAGELRECKSAFHSDTELRIINLKHLLASHLIRKEKS